MVSNTEMIQFVSKSSTNINTEKDSATLDCKFSTKPVVVNGRPGNVSPCKIQK